MHKDMDAARTWAQNHLDCSYEILIRTIEEQDIQEQILESKMNDSTGND
jgi:hypothetical protein